MKRPTPLPTLRRRLTYAERCDRVMAALFVLVLLALACGFFD